MKTARVVDASPALGEALATGNTTAAHVGALARVVSPRRQALLTEHGEVLAKQAGRLSIKDFTTLARRWAVLADDHLAADSHDDHVPRNTLHGAFTMDGWVDGSSISTLRPTRPMPPMAFAGLPNGVETPWASSPAGTTAARSRAAIRPTST